MTAALPQWASSLHVGSADDFDFDGLRTLADGAAVLAAEDTVWVGEKYAVALIAKQSDDAHLRLAALFAASPDLLDALSLAVRLGERSRAPDADELEFMRAALAKVGGAL